MERKDEIFIFGHRNPDTDSVTSAISLAYLKEKLGFNAIPSVLSSINLESKYALNYFKVPEPIFLNDVYIKVKDLKYTKNYTIDEGESIYKAYFKMEKVGITKIPVVDKFKKLIGILSMKHIALSQFSKNFSMLDTSFDNIVDTLSGTNILKYEDNIKGTMMVAGYRSTTFIEEIVLNNSNILIVGDRHSIIEYAIDKGIKLLIVTGGHKIKEEHLKLAKERHVNIIYTPYGTLETAKIINLSNKVSTIMERRKFLCINENDDINKFIGIANKTRYSYYPVLGKNDKCLGILRFSDIGYNNKKKVILVDHNSYEQSAIGLEDAEIIEIIDHHNIGTIGTNMPINFRNVPVGSTNTIIYTLYKENEIEIPKDIAGVMLSGILSDTLILTSPTTTDQDRKAVLKLSEIAGVDYKKYGYDMITAGTSLKGKSIEEILYTDFKTYNVDNKKIGLGQIITTDISEITNKIKEYVDTLNDACKRNDYYFVVLFVTDILKNGSYVIYSDNAMETIKYAFNLETIKQGQFLPNLVSRKKQMLPEIMQQMGAN